MMETNLFWTAVVVATILFSAAWRCHRKGSDNSTGVALRVCGTVWLLLSYAIS